MSNQPHPFCEPGWPPDPTKPPKEPEAKPYTAEEFCGTSRETLNLQRVRATLEQRDMMARVLKSVLPYLSTGTVFGNINEARNSVEIALGMREP